MNNLMTRKIVLGLLMVLVLAFSVQGTADALTFSNLRGNFQSYEPGESITLSFSVNLRNVMAVDSEGDRIYQADNGTGLYYSYNSRGSDSDYFSISSLTARTKGNEALTVPENLVQVYDYDDEQITIATENPAISTLMITRNGIDYQLGTLQERIATGAAHLPSSITLTGTAPVVDRYQVTVSDETPEDDRPLGEPNAPGLTFTIYVRNPSQEVRLTTISPAANLESQIATSRAQVNNSFTYGIVQGSNTDNSTMHVPVEYTVNGPGYLYIFEDPDQSPQVRTLNTSSNAPVYINMNGGTNKVTARIIGPANPVTVTYIYRWSNLTKVSGDSPKQTGAPNSRLEDPFIVQVLDSNDRAVSGQTVMFTAINGKLLSDPATPANLEGIQDTTRTVKTDSNGRANIFMEVATSGTPSVDATFNGQTVTFEALIGTGATPTASSIAIVSGDGQQADQYGIVEDSLVVVVRDQRGRRLQGATVTFLVRDGGELDPPASDEPGAQSTDSGANTSSTAKDIKTDENGEASVRYTPPEAGGRRTVSASVRAGLRSVTFTVNGTGGGGGGGSGGGGGGGGDDDDADPDVITFSDTTIEGEPGDEVDITVRSSPSNAIVELSSPDFENSNFSPQFGRTPFVTTLTLPDETGSHDIFATRSEFTPAAGTVTVGAGALGTLTISPTGTAVNGVQTVSITARTAAGTIPSGSLTVALSGTGFTTTSAIVLNGTVNAGITLPTTAATYTLTVSATGYNSASTLLTVGTTTGTTTTTTTRGPAGEADSVEIDGSRQLSGTVDQAMRLRVRVLDANDNGVSDVRVTFRVLAPGRGTFAGARGNGRAVADQTDRNGYASANLTPSDDGDIIVRASAAGVSADVTFIIDVGEASADPETPTPSRDVTPSRDISPVVHVGVASRPPMLWIDGGAIYGLVGADAQKFAPSVDNALNITVAGGKVYWTEMTGESSGTINSANLNGSGVTELTSIMAVPMGIAVDVAGSKLYWTNSRGRIQSANLDGSRITNELQDLPSPMDIALGNGNVYWTQGNGSVRVVNLTGQKIVRDISTGSDTPGSLVIGGGKVYWTEKTGDSSGTINSANLNGTGATQLASIQRGSDGDCG